MGKPALHRHVLGLISLDHHCPWVNNCVGHYNYGHFIRFLFYVDVACSYHLVMVTKRVMYTSYNFWVSSALCGFSMNGLQCCRTSPTSYSLYLSFSTIPFVYRSCWLLGASGQFLNILTRFVVMQGIQYIPLPRIVQQHHHNRRLGEGQSGSACSQRQAPRSTIQLFVLPIGHSHNSLDQIPIC